MVWMLVALSACTNDPVGRVPEQADTGLPPGSIVDLTMEFDPPPPGGVQILLGDVTIPPSTESFICLYGTWTDPDAAVTYVSPYQSKFGHHAQLKAVPAGYEQPDGTQRVCPGPDSMNLFTPFFEAVVAEEGIEVDPTNMMMLPEGVAVKLAQGQHWTFDTHWVNTSENYINVNAALNLGFMDTAEVTDWASSFQLDVGILEIPAGEAISLPFDCGFPEDLTVISLLGHMHGYGTSYAVDHLREDGSVVRVYDIPVWEEDFRDQGVVQPFSPGELVVQSAEALRTTCSWYNPTDHILEFPEEMCTTVGVGYPLEEPFACFRDVPQE